MERTVTDAIREVTARHIAEHNGLVLGQCLSAVGWVQNTVPPQREGLEELPMTDVAGAGYAAGAALAGRRPIFVIRFQSLLWLNASPIVNYAAKAKDLFGYGCPVFVRAIAAEGGATGPIHSGAFHGMFMNVPGLPVVAPMTPGEYEDAYERFMASDAPLFVSEHRRSYKNTREMPDQIEDGAKITLFAASSARFTAGDAVVILRSRGIPCNLVHLVWLKPFVMDERLTGPLRTAGCGLVVDSCYETSGPARSMAYELSVETGLPVHALGLEERQPGAAAHLDNVTPSAERIAGAAMGVLARQAARA